MTLTSGREAAHTILALLAGRCTAWRTATGLTDRSEAVATTIARRRKSEVKVTTGRLLRSDVSSYSGILSPATRIQLLGRCLFRTRVDAIQPALTEGPSGFQFVTPVHHS